MAAVTTASVWSVWWRWQPRFLFVILVAVTTAYGGDDRIVHRAVTTASQYTICVCLWYLRSQFGSGIFSSARVGASASQTMSKRQREEIWEKGEGDSKELP